MMKKKTHDQIERQLKALPWKKMYKFYCNSLIGQKTINKDALKRKVSDIVYDYCSQYINHRINTKFWEFSAFYGKMEQDIILKKIDCTGLLSRIKITITWMGGYKINIGVRLDDYYAMGILDSGPSNRSTFQQASKALSRKKLKK